MGLAHAGRAAQAVALAAHQGSDAVLQGIEAAGDREVHLSPAHPGVGSGGETVRACARARPLAAGMAPAGVALASTAACGLRPRRPGGVGRLRRQPAVVTRVEPEGRRADLLAAGAGHLADVPAAAGGRAVGLHQGDRQLPVVAGLLAGLDQPPEEVAVVGVGVAAGHTAGDGGQSAADLLQRPRLSEVLVSQLGQWNPSAWNLVGLLQGNLLLRRGACSGFGELIGQQRQGDVLRRVALSAHVHQLHQGGGLPAGIHVPAARQPHHP